MTVPDELWTVARCFGDILDDVVFVGGMIRELLITDPAAGPPRPTRDVDCIVNVGSYVDYAHLSDRLRRRGFAECTDDGAPLCRWIVEQVRVDVMPIDPAVLGFSNVWPGRCDARTTWSRWGGASSETGRSWTASSARAGERSAPPSPAPPTSPTKPAASQTSRGQVNPGTPVSAKGSEIFCLLTEREQHTVHLFRY